MNKRMVLIGMGSAAVCGVALLIPKDGAATALSTVGAQADGAQQANASSNALPDGGPNRTWPVDCDDDHAGALQRAVDRAGTGDTVLVTGTCNENVSVPEGTQGITLDGGGTAMINGPVASLNDVSVRGRNITITGFTITGGRAGIDVGRGASAVVKGNVIERTGRVGVTVGSFGTANVADNTIQDNPNNGILVTGNAYAFIGFLNAEDVVANPNIIRRNGVNGISVTLSASARIAGNLISDNVRQGISLTQATHAIISSNTIDHNGQHGIFVSENSGVNLGADTGSGLFEAPNRTTVSNALNGINCRVGGYANGRLGTLGGDSGTKSFGATCIDTLDAPDSA